MQIDFDKMFKVTLIAMRLNSSDPYCKRDKRWFLQFTCMHGPFFLICCGLVYCIITNDIKGNHIIQACSNGVLCVVFCVVTFSYFVMVWYQTLFKDMMDIMKNDYFNVSNLPSDEQKIISKYAEMGKGVVALWLRISICTAGLFPIKSIVCMIYYAIVGEFKFVHLYDLTYPLIIEKIKNEPLPYTVLYLIFLYYDLYAMIMYLGFQPLGPIFMLHACGQLELIKKRVLEIFNDNEIDPNKVINDLRDVIIHLQATYRFIEGIKTSFKVFYEFTLKATTITVPITFYLVIQSYHENRISLEFITIIFGALTLSSIPCYYSDLLMEKGEDLRLAIYLCGWEKYWDKRTRLLLLLVLARAGRPVAVRTMFSIVCLDALTDIFHQSYAIFNLLNAVWN